MKRMKNVMLVLLCFLCLSGCNYKDDDQVKKYEKKHGIDVIVTHWGAINEGNMGHTYHTVQAKITKIFNLE